MILAPFLTDLDPRAAVKGSRDPLGIQSIWTRLGRHVIGNLSTVSNSVRDFTVLMLGYHFAARVAETNGPGTELATFLKWEQLAAYARGHVNQDWRFRGTEKARSNIESGEVVLSAEPGFQILSSQKLYGIWGLYSVPGRSSGLLEGDTARLSRAAQELIDDLYLPALRQGGVHDEKRLVEILAKPQTRLNLSREPDLRLLKSVARLLKPHFSSRERAFYREHLLFGGPNDSTEGRQRQMVELLEPRLTGAEFQWSPAAVDAFAKEAETMGEAWHPLAFRLRRIGVAERVLAPASALFTYLLGCNNVTLAELARRIRHPGSCGEGLRTINLPAVSDVATELGGGDQSAEKRWLHIAEAMAGGEYKTLISHLLEQNKSVMQARGGAAWIDELNGKLNVRVQEERGELPRRADLPSFWRFPYFLDSLCAVSFALKEGGKE